MTKYAWRNSYWEYLNFQDSLCSKTKERLNELLQIDGIWGHVLRRQTLFRAADDRKLQKAIITSIQFVRPYFYLYQIFIYLI